MVGKEKNNVFVFYRGRVTKVAPECLRKASVAEQMSWDISTKEKALFEKALDVKDLACEESMLDKSYGSLDTEMPDTAAEPPPLEGEDSPPVIDEDDGSPVSEAPIDPEASREVESDQLRRSLTTKRSRKLGRVPELSFEEKEEMESRLKKARANVSELVHDAFLVKSARSQEKRWHGLNGREKLLFLSKQWNAWQENAATTVIPPAEAKVIWRTLRKQGLQDRVMQSRFVLVDKNEGKSTAECSHCGSWIRRSRCVRYTRRLTNRLSRCHQCPAGCQCQ